MTAEHARVREEHRQMIRDLGIPFECEQGVAQLVADYGEQRERRGVERALEEAKFFCEHRVVKAMRALLPEKQDDVVQ